MLVVCNLENRRWGGGGWWRSCGKQWTAFKCLHPKCEFMCIIYLLHIKSYFFHLYMNWHFLDTEEGNLFFRESLTNTLPVFEYRHSSDDEMLSADDIESTDDSEYQMEDPNFDHPGTLKNMLWTSYCCVFSLINVGSILL